jgi:hypothetical protein
LLEVPEKCSVFWVPALPKMVKGESETEVPTLLL